MSYKIVTLSGDGIGPEIIESSKKVLLAVGKKFKREYYFEDCLIGGIAIDKTGTALPQDTIEKALTSNAVLLGAVGGDKWDNFKERPESALLKMRKVLGLYANIRPAKLFSALAQESVLKQNIVQKGIDLVTVRELTGGIYFGECGYRTNAKYGREAFDTESYSELEIERVARIAYELAQKRKHHVTLVDKANVLTTSKLWRKIVTDINEDYPDVMLDMMYIDNAAMQLALNPNKFDVVLTSNLFGDILSDFTAAIVGSIGVMPSASLGDTTIGMYEAIHGSAPSIAGQNIANPIGTILSSAMLLRLSLDQEQEALTIENAIECALNDGCKTRDLGGEMTTTQITQEIIDRL